MKEQFRKFGKVGLWVPFILLAILLAGAPEALAGGDPPPRQFTDAEYLENGLDPILNPVNPHNRPPTDFDPNYFMDPLDGVDDGGRSTLHDDGTIEINALTGGFNHTGKRIYYSVLSKFNEGAFTDNEAGDEAREIADDFVAYIFPKAGGLQFVPGFTNRRQDNLFDTRHGYFSNNPLGLWRLAFVKWVGTMNTPDPAKCQDLRESLLDENGPDLDGTPIINTMSDLEDAEDEGCILVRSRKSDGSLPDSFPDTFQPNENGGPPVLFRWVV